MICDGDTSLGFTGVIDRRNSAASRERLLGPVQGKTYSLYGRGTTTDSYFDAVGDVVRSAICRTPDPERLVDQIAATGRSRRRARRAVASPNPEVARIFHEAASHLDPFFDGIDSHRAALSIRERCGSTLGMNREQYLLAAVEIELRNQLNAAAFVGCREKLAFLPHCLHDLESTCAAKPHGLDTICMACSDACYLNAVSRVLRKHHVRPYIWMTANLSRILREKAKVPGSLGVLGVACIPELVAGMRRCARARVPVVGLPLDANRCARWFGEFRPNTVTLSRLEGIFAGVREEACA